MYISEYLELLASHDVPGTSVVVENIRTGGDNYQHVVSVYCPCENRETHRFSSQKTFGGRLTASTIQSLLTQGYILQSISAKPLSALNLWVFTKPPVCPNCSGGIAEC